MNLKKSALALALIMMGSSAMAGQFVTRWYINKGTVVNNTGGNGGNTGGSGSPSVTVNFAGIPDAVANSSVSIDLKPYLTVSGGSVNEVVFSKGYTWQNPWNLTSDGILTASLPGLYQPTTQNLEVHVDYRGEGNPVATTLQMRVIPEANAVVQATPSYVISNINEVTEYAAQLSSWCGFDLVGSMTPLVGRVYTDANSLNADWRAALPNNHFCPAFGSNISLRIGTALSGNWTSSDGNFTEGEFIYYVRTDVRATKGYAYYGWEGHDYFPPHTPSLSVSVMYFDVLYNCPSGYNVGVPPQLTGAYKTPPVTNCYKIY